MTNPAIIFPVKSPYHPETAEAILRAVEKNDDDPVWLAQLRQAGVEYLTARGLPTPKLEGWKFTNFIPLVKNYSTCSELNFVMKSVAGVSVEPIAEAAEEQWVQDLLNTDVPGEDHNSDPSMMHLANVFFRDGIVIDVAAGVEVAEPLMMDVIAGVDIFSSAQSIIRLGSNARLTIIEDHRSDGKLWKNILTRIVLGQGAQLTHVRIQEDSEEAVYTQAMNVELDKDSVYEGLSLAVGGSLSRNQVRVALNAPGGVCHINGVNLMRGTQHADTTILVEHFAPHCESNQNMRTILDDQAHGVFQGKIHVHQPAQKTNGYQLSRALILSEGAEMDTKPELEIYADDVKCSHGATTGRMDEEPLFYMQSRGISRDEARALLIEAFAAEVLGVVADRPFYEGLMGRGEIMAAKLSAVQQATMASFRADFPVLQKKMNGLPVAFLDTGASAQKPRQVIDAMRAAMDTEYANIHRGLYQFSQVTTAKFEAVRGKVADFIGAGSEREIVFTRNATESINLVAQSWGRTFLKAGDEVVITGMEHHANIVPWQLLRDQIGIVLRVVPVLDDGTLDLDRLGLGEKTKLVAFTHVSNALGTINPVEAIVRQVRDYNPAIRILVDGSQGVVHGAVNVTALDVDFYVFTGHKLYGPTGIGVLYGRYEVLQSMPPYQGGGDMIERVTFDKTTYKDAPARFEAGTPAIVEVIGLGAAIDYVANIGMDAIAAREQELLAYGLEQLAGVPGLTLYGPANNRAGIMSFTADWGHASDIAMVLDQCGVAVRSGHHCCQPLMDRLGTDATVRASLGLYSNTRDIDQLIMGLMKAHGLLGA